MTTNSVSWHLLLVAGEGEATPVPLQVRTLRQFPGEPGLSVHFRPVRHDRLFESAKAAGQLAYRILTGEGVLRRQLWIEYQVGGRPVNVTGRSADLLFALVLVASLWQPAEPLPIDIAATGVLDEDGTVGSVRHVVAKVAAAVQALQSSSRAVLFYPREDAPAIEDWSRGRPLPPQIRLVPVGHLDEALTALGYVLEKVYLGNPFRGLEHFDYEHRAIFFGRDAEVGELIAQLLRREAAGQPGVIIEGPSGSGKSSFLRAGVLPALIDPRHLASALQEPLRRQPVPRSAAHAIWRPNLLSPGADERQVTQAIAQTWSTALHPTAGDATQVGSLSALADALTRIDAADRRLLWCIDPFEPLFTLDLAPGVLAALGGFLLRLQERGVWTLATLRSDAISLFKEQALLRQAFGANEGEYYLPNLTGVAIEEAIRRPAVAAGLSFETRADGVGLDQLLREEADRQPGSLPLLQFTLNELYRHRSQQLLTVDAYRSLGGLAGSISSAATRVLGERTPAGSPVARLLRGLVRLNEQGRAIRRYAVLEEFARDTAARELLERLIEARLCITDQRDGRAVVAFAHDSLIDTLPLVVEWLKQEKDILRTRDLVEHETLLWVEHGRSDAWLASADQLTDFRALSNAEVFLSDSVRDYLSRSQARTQRAQRLRRTAIAAIAVLACIASVAAVIATRKKHEAEVQSALTVMAQRRSLAEAAAGRLKDGDLSYARGIVVSVLKDQSAAGTLEQEAISVFQDVRALDPLEAILAGHEGGVLELAYSPDGSRLVTASIDGTARIWDARTGAELSVLHRDTEYAIHCPDYSRDGSRLLTTSGGVAKLWDAHSQVQIASLSGGSEKVRCAVFSPDSTLVAAAIGRNLHFWEAASGHDVRTVAAPMPGLMLSAWSPDGSKLLGDDPQHVAYVIDAKTGVLIAKMSAHTKPIYAAAFSPDSTRVATASGDGTARVWNAANGSELFTLKPNVGEVRGIAFSPDGRYIATGATNKQARLWDAASGALLKQFTGHQAILGGLAFSPDSRHLATSGYDGTARVWRIADSPEARILSGHTGSVDGVQYSPDGTRVLTVSSDRTARLWDAHSGVFINSLKGAGGIQSAVYSHDGKTIVTGCADSRIRIWDAATLRPLKEIPVGGAVFMVDVSHDGKRIAAMVDYLQARVWDSASGRLLLTLRGHSDSINGVEFSPDDKRILTASVDKTARIWDAVSGQQLLVLPHPDYLMCGTWSPDGMTILTGANDKALRLWDVATGEKRMTLMGHSAFVFSARFSRDGRRIVSGSKDSTIRLWDAHSGEQLAMLPGHQQQVWSVAWSPDGRHIASASRDQSARIWNAELPANLHQQILWAQASEVDPFSDVEARRLGILASAPSNREDKAASDCDRFAAAPYDPDRVASGVDASELQGEVAAAACDKVLARDPRMARALFQRARAAAARQDYPAESSALSAAVAQGYRVAQVDLAQLKTRPEAKLLDGLGAIALLEKAWTSGVHIAAQRLGGLWESGVPGSATTPAVKPDVRKAWEWYARGAQVKEPTALARFAARDEHDALNAPTASERETLLRRAFVGYAKAVEFALHDGWPDASLRQWRYRRATLARVLAANRQMVEVAADFAEVLDQTKSEDRSVAARWFEFVRWLRFN